jgi:hypothetical protein
MVIAGPPSQEVKGGSLVRRAEQHQFPLASLSQFAGEGLNSERAALSEEPPFPETPIIGREEGMRADGSSETVNLPLVL